jgi:poly(3-hydroxyalkanoate) synthetase
MNENAPRWYEPVFPPPPSYFAWPFIAFAAAGEALAAQANEVARALSAASAEAGRSPKFAWSAPNHVRLDMSTMELRDFSRAPEGVPTLICAPFALHDATIADLAPGHSLVDALACNGCHRLFVTDWRPASADMRLLTIDSYLADLNVAVDELGAPVDLVGLCQGGWMALAYAARFPAKVRKLVLAGAPIDTDVGVSRISTAAHSLPLSVFDELARLGDGRVLGHRAIDLWEPALQANDALAALQVQPCEQSGKEQLLERFRAWSDSTVDLPGAFFHQVVLWLFKENRLARGRFTALGRQIDLVDVRHPLFLLVAEGDAVVPPEQLLAVRRLVGTSPADIESAIEPGGHLSLFIGADTLHGAWARIARWLAQPHGRDLGDGMIAATPVPSSRPPSEGVARPDDAASG